MLTIQYERCKVKIEVLFLQIKKRMYKKMGDKDHMGVRIEKDTIIFSLGRNDSPVQKKDDLFLSLYLAHFIEVAGKKFPHKRDDLIKVVDKVKEVATSELYPKTARLISDFLPAN